MSKNHEDSSFFKGGTGNKINTSQSYFIELISAQKNREVTQTTQTSYFCLNLTEFVSKVKQQLYLKSPVQVLLDT